MGSVRSALVVTAISLLNFYKTTSRGWIDQRRHMGTKVPLLKTEFFKPYIGNRKIIGKEESNYPAYNRSDREQPLTLFTTSCLMSIYTSTKKLSTR